MSENEEIKKLLEDLIESTNKTIESHAPGLKRHEENHVATFKTADTLA